LHDRQAAATALVEGIPVAADAVAAAVQAVAESFHAEPACTQGPPKYTETFPFPTQ
jgi:hypothetical protein